MFNEKLLLKSLVSPALHRIPSYRTAIYHAPQQKNKKRNAAGLWKTHRWYIFSAESTDKLSDGESIRDTEPDRECDRCLP